MELELSKTHLTGYETVIDTTVFREETLESIVTDTGPDILRLIDTQGTAFLKEKEALDGQVTLTGTARLAVLYLPENGTGPCRMEINIPFRLTLEDPRIRAGSAVTAMPRIAGADTRILNPRKVVTRVEIAADVAVYSAESGALCCSAAAVDGVVEQLVQTRQMTCIAAVQEKRFSFEDDLNIPASRPAAEELMCSRVSLSCRDRKIIGNKLVFKGDAAVQLLYRSAGGGLDVVDFMLPFSQITEVAGVGENGRCTVDVCLAGAEFVLGNDGRSVTVSMSMLSQAVVREDRNVELLVDMYSTCCPVRVQCAPYRYQVCLAEGTARQAVREVIEAGMQIKAVTDVSCRIGRLMQSREQGDLHLTAQVTVSALCVTEDGEYCAVSRGMEVSCDAEIPEGCICQCSCCCGDLSASPTADGVEVRFYLEFPYLALQEAAETVVCDAGVEPGEEENSVNRPSIVLRVTGEGEKLWDVAKRYGTTIADIVKANELEEEQPCAGTLLLIPRKR